MNIKIKKIHKDAIVPKYATNGAACFDLHAVEAGYYNSPVSVDNPRVIRTGLSFEVPAGYVMLIFSRSGHAFKEDIRLSNCVGVIDSDYRGEVQVKLIKDRSITAITTYFNTGDRIAQAMIIPVTQVNFEEVAELSSTDRGTGGFGSTGK